MHNGRDISPDDTRIKDKLTRASDTRSIEQFDNDSQLMTQLRVTARASIACQSPLEVAQCGESNPLGELGETQSILKRVVTNASQGLCKR